MSTVPYYIEQVKRAKLAVSSPQGEKSVIAEVSQGAANTPTEDTGGENSRRLVMTLEDPLHVVVAEQQGGESWAGELPVCCWFCNKDFPSFQLLRSDLH